MLILFEKKYVFIFQIEFMIILSPLWSANNLIHIANNAHTSALKQGEFIILSSLIGSRDESMPLIVSEINLHNISYHMIIGPSKLLIVIVHKFYR